MCASCGEVFPAEVARDDVILCPVCGHEGKPAGVMRVTGFPSLEAFKRNWQKSQEAAGAGNVDEDASP